MVNYCYILDVDEHASKEEIKKLSQLLLNITLTKIKVKMPKPNLRKLWKHMRCYLTSKKKKRDMILVESKK